MTRQAFWRSPALPFVESRRARDSSACYALHSHPALSIGAVDSGQSTFTRSGRQTRLTSGDVVVIPAGEVHSCNPEEDGRWSYQMLYLAPDWVESVVGEMGALDAAVIEQLPARQNPKSAHAALSALNACLFGETEDAEKETALVAFVGSLLGPRAAGNGPINKPVPRRQLSDVMAHLEAHLCESVPLLDLARIAGMSRYHLVRAFGRTVGMTPHAWQLDLRIQHARRLLDQGMPLAEAALALGFADQSHFQRAFKARVAATPRQYQRNFFQD